MREVQRVSKGWAAMGPKSRLQHQNLYLPDRPEGDQPQLPSDLTESTDRELMALFTQLTIWSSWADVVVSQAEVDERCAEEVVAKIKALNNITNAGAKTVTAAKAKMYEDPDFIAAQEQELAAYSYRKLASAIANGIDKKIGLVSRELSRRLSRNDHQNREGKFTP